MKIIDTKKENNKVIMTIKADSELWSKELAKTKKQLAKNLSIPGFRKGHAPQKIIDEHITMNQVISETVNKYVNQLIDKFMSEEAKKHADIIVNSLKVDLVEIDPEKLTLKFEFEKQPIIQLDGYDAMKIDYIEPEVTDKEIEFEIKNAIKNDYMLSAKEDGVIAKGDMVKFDFEGFIGDKAIDGGAAKDYELEIGSGLFIPGFEDQMIGLKKGEKKTIEVTFPKNYPVEEYRNKKAKFNLLIKEVSKITYPTLDKVYLAKFNLPNVENETQFRDYIKKEIKRIKGTTKRQELIKIIRDWVVKNIKIDYIPDYFIKSETNAIKQDYELQAKNKFNKKLEDAVVDLGFKSMDDFNKQIHDKVVNNIKFSLGMDKLITLLAINVTKEEIEKEITDTARKINMNVNELLNNQNILNSIKQYMLNDKIVQKLLEVNKKQTKNIEKK